MILSTLGQASPEQKQAAIVATALTKDSVTIGGTGNPVVPLLAVAGLMVWALWKSSSPSSSLSG